MRRIRKIQLSVSLDPILEEIIQDEAESRRISFSAMVNQALAILYAEKIKIKESEKKAQPLIAP